MSSTSLPDTAIFAFPAGYGASSVSWMDSGTEIFTAIDAVNKAMGYTDFDSVIAGEIGRGNGFSTFLAVSSMIARFWMPISWEERIQLLGKERRTRLRLVRWLMRRAMYRS